MPIVKLFPQTIITAGNAPWTNPDNAKADDGAYAVTPGERNVYADIMGTGFPNSIPPGSVINSVCPEAKYKLSTAASAGTIYMNARYDGVSRGSTWSNSSEPLTDFVLTSTYTGAWTLEELNSDLAMVQVRVRRTSATVCNYSIDYIALNVDYTEPAVVTGFTGSGTMSGTGENTASGIKSASGQGGTSGDGAISSSCSKGSSGAGEMAGTGSMAGSGIAQTITYDYTGSGAMGGIGSNDANGIKEARAPTVFLEASGSIHAEGTKQATGTGTVSGTGEASASGMKQATGSGELTGIGIVTGIGSTETPTYDYAGEGSMAGISEISGEGVKTSEGTGTITGTGETTGTGNAGMVGEGEISGVGHQQGAGTAGELFRAGRPSRVTMVMDKNEKSVTRKAPSRTTATINNINRVVIIIDQ